MAAKKKTEKKSEKMEKETKRHEMTEGPKARMKEYGSKTGGMKPSSYPRKKKG
jgi:hypothetical protein